MFDKPRAERHAPRCAGVLFFIALSAFAVACEDSGGLGTVRPKLILDPDAPQLFEFDEVVIGRSTAEPVIIKVSNGGTGVLTLDTVEIQNDAAGAFRVSSYPEALPPSGSNELWVRFEPKVQGAFEATLYIQSNDPERRNVTYTLKGSAREPCTISVGPPHTRMLLGEIAKITVTARGGTDCRITYLFTDETLFPFIDAPETPFVIPTGTSLDLSVQHVATPQQPGIPIREILVKESEGQEVKVSVEGEPPIFGCIDIFPTTRLLFDQTPIGETAQLSETVFNRCSRPAYVTSALITIGVYFYDIDEDSFPMEIPPLGSVDIPVVYTPFSEAGDDGRLVLNTNDAGAARFELQLFGQAAVPSAVVFPAVLDFGTVVYKNPRPDDSSECSSGSQVVQVYNQGATNLTVSRLEIAGDSRFEVSGVISNGAPVADFTQPFQVGPGRDAKISLRFAPTHEMPAEHQARLLIHHNSEGTPSEVTLLGNSAPVGVATDVFTQLAGPKADILWVIDDSCSMFDEQARLIANLSQFIAYADSLNADYQMAVVDTDGTSPFAGIFEQCFPHPRIISNSYADSVTREEAFECLFSLGVSGSGVEAGLAAAKAALVRATAADQDPVRNRNAGFVRDDAKLVVVIMSDEEDQSNESDDLLRDYFLAIKPNRRDLVRINAIAGPVFEACPTGEQAAMPGYRYFNMTQETGGQFFNICLEDWQPLLTNLGVDTFTPLDEFTLSQSADPATLTVLVDGNPVPPSATQGYTYNAAANTVKFNGSSLPPPGAEITIDYEGLCRP